MTDTAAGMFRTFVYAIILIIASVAVFNFIIFKGRMPAMLTFQSLRDVGEPCDEDSFCYEPLQCMSGVCTLVVTEKGGTCNDLDLRCERPLFCHGSLCKEKVGAGSACDEKSMQVCSTETFCLDGVCRSKIEDGRL